MLQNDIDAFEKSFLNEDDPFAGLHDDTHLNSVASILKRFFHRWQDSKSWMVMWICQFKWQMKLYLTKTMSKNYWSSTQYNHRLPEPIFPKEYFDQIMIIAREYLCLDSTFIAHMCAGSLMQRIWQVIMNYHMFPLDLQRSCTNMCTILIEQKSAWVILIIFRNSPSNWG